MAEKSPPGGNDATQGVSQFPPVNNDDQSGFVVGQSSIAGGGSTSSPSCKSSSSTMAKTQKHSKNPNYRESKGKNQVIKCRACAKEVKYQNYESHLKSQHPSEDFKDLRSKSDNSIQTMFKSKSKRAFPFNNDDDEPPIKVANHQISDINSNLAMQPAVSDEASSTRFSLTSEVSGLTSDQPSPGSITQPENDENKYVEAADTLEISRLLEKLSPLAQLDENTISKLVTNIEELSKMKLESKPAVRDSHVDQSSAGSMMDNETILMSSCSLADITTRFQEFEYNAKLGGVICILCSAQANDNKDAVFDYPSDLESDFKDKLKSKKFSNLKISLKRHLQRQTHQNALALATSKANLQFKEDTRNKMVALRISRIAYFLLKSGRPDTDFTSHIYLHSANGSDVGDINHSAQYPSKFLVHVTTVLENQLKSFLSSRLDQTGHKPPTKVVADKATWQHQTRQLMVF